MCVFQMDTQSGDDSQQPTAPRLSLAQLARVAPPPTRDGEPEVRVVLGSEDWHAVVPPVSSRSFKL